MKGHYEKVKLQYKFLSRIYDFMDMVIFPLKKGNPHLGLAAHISNENISVLDVCFGTGNNGIGIAAKNDRNKVTGIDISEPMLNVAKNKIRRMGLKNLSLLCADAASIKLSPDFDIVTTSLSLHEMPKDIMDSVVSEMARVVRKNGKIYIIEWEKPKAFFSSMVFMIFPYIFEPNGFRNFLKLDWREYLNQFGLKVEGIERYTFTKLIIANKE